MREIRVLLGQAQPRRRSLAIAVAGLATVLILLGCIHSKPYRPISFVDASPVEACRTSATDPEACRTKSLQRITYNYGGGADSTGQPPHYYLSVIEFDSQGWLHDRRQMEAVLELLYKQKQEVLILVFAHGWRHNSDRCDDNLICFQRILERFDILEREGKRLARSQRKGGDPKETAADSVRGRPRVVIGVYLGWRGLSAKGRLPSYLSFWSRKSAAKRVGLGGVTEVLSRLNEYREYRQSKLREKRCPESLCADEPCSADLDPRYRDGTSLVISGHSMGAKVVYSALSHHMIERVTEMESRISNESAPADRSSDKGDEPSTEHGESRDLRFDTVKSFGDLVVLLSPAFEASLYEPLHQAATNRCYRAIQRPVMMIVTSEADSPNRVFFPLGRWFSSAFERFGSRAQRRAVRSTVGHVSAYRTHELRLEAGKAAPQGKKEHCSCGYLEDASKYYRDLLEEENSDLDFLLELAQYQQKVKVPSGAGDPRCRGSVEDWFTTTRMKEGRIEYLKGVVLSLSSHVPQADSPRYSPNFPFLVVRTDKELIPSHNRIYGKEFTTFLRRFYVAHIDSGENFPRECWQKPDCHPSGIEPCERSCVRQDGTACSGRSPRPPLPVDISLQDQGPEEANPRP